MAQEYKLKLDSLDLKPGEKREVEVEGLQDTKVLLVQDGIKVRALSPKCTHYGAPLVNGVLDDEGRLTCPWHGACFNISTGDVEDAPALDALHSFSISTKNGAYYIQGEESALKAGRRGLIPQLSVPGQEKVLIIGGGSGAVGALEALRIDGFKGSITVISSEGYLPIDRTKLSKALIPEAAKIALRDSEWYSKAGIEMVQDQVTGIDFSSKSASTESGKSYPYTKLVLATGGTPNMLPLPGFKDLGNIFLLRTVHHVQDIVNAVGEKKKKIVVVGSSFIGMEVANALAKENDVVVVGMEKAPLERVMGAEVGEIFRGILEKNGVKFKMEAGVESASPSKADPKKVGAVHLKDGSKLEADLVILGIGVKPQTSYLQDNKQVHLEKDGSLKTNRQFEVEGIKDVYAIGDIATFPYDGPGGEGALTRIEHWNVAQNAGRAVGAAIAQKKSASKQFIPVFWSALGSQLRYCGNTPNGWDQLEIKGNPKEGKFAAFYAKHNTVVAVASMGMDPVMSKSAMLMRKGKMPTLAAIRDGADVLGVEVF